MTLQEDVKVKNSTNVTHIQDLASAIISPDSSKSSEEFDAYLCNDKRGKHLKK